MTDKILALVDGSIYSRSVCDHAAWIAGRTGAAVELMHVLGRREGSEKSDLSGSISLGARSALLEQLTALDEQRAKLAAQHGRAILDDARAILEADLAADVQAAISTHLRHGDLIETVAAQEAGASMVLIGKRGEAADFAKGHLGSNLERVVRASGKPVFVASRAFKPIHSMLIAHDGGSSAMRAVDHVSRSPLYAGLEVKVVTIGSETRDAAKGLEDAKAMLKAGGIQAETVLTPGHPETTLARLVDAWSTDLLVMGAYGHSRLRNLLVGSTTTEMIRSCKIPVVLIR
jgi:nucleotide-binding universal stress UspA family protein